MIERKDLAAWLRRNDFDELANVGTGHLQFVHRGTNVKVVLPGHGKKELAKNTLSNILRDLERAGWDRAQLRKELAS